MEIKTFLQNNKQNIINDLATLVSYNSVSEYDENYPQYPFGPVTKEVLDKALAMFEREGLKTENVDYYAGFGEIGSGKELIGLLAHLDVVPATAEGWTSDPFTLTQRGNKLFGRGAMDDKGPAIASLYALKYLIQENYPLNKRIRLIVGLNEERGSKGLKHYVEKHGHIDYGFTPDGSFPGIYGEKGHIGGSFKTTSENIIDIQGGTVANAVCSKVTAKLVANSFDTKILTDYLNENELKFEITEDKQEVTITVNGIAAHASMPELGKNAISHLMKGLYKANINDKFVTYYNTYIGLYTDGTLFDCKLSDKYGALTFNNGLISLKNGFVEGSIDIRVPVTINPEEVVAKMKSIMNDENGEIFNMSATQPLFFDPESKMVKSLVSAYRSVTKDETLEPMVIGGGTYSKGINNCIAFGGEFVGDDNHIHDVDEFIEIDKLLLQIEIYVQAIKNLLAI